MLQEHSASSPSISDVVTLCGSEPCLIHGRIDQAPQRTSTGLATVNVSH